MKNFRTNKKQRFFIFLNRAMVLILVLLQVAFFLYFIQSSSKISEWINYSLNIISLLVMIHVISTREKSGFKLLWTILVLLFPIFGGVTYLIFHIQGYTLHFRRSLTNLEFNTRQNMFLGDSGCQNAIEHNADNIRNITYLQNTVGFPVFQNTYTQFLSPGEIFYPKLLEELEKAENYIFIESFIIDDGTMWDGILKILEEKAAKGLDVRVIYDDVGSLLLHSGDFPKSLKKRGIKCCVFNRFKPFFLVSMNHRDHRKIAVIDGKVAFTGGINIADEYINERERFGYWKDADVMIVGQSAWNFAVIFLQIWNFSMRSDEIFENFYPWKNENCTVESDGFVQPFADSPTDNENVSEHVYLHMIYSAKDYLYIETPYFAVDDSFVSALIMVAKSGVDVRIVLPNHWDKFFIREISRGYYRQLIEGGVRVYEYLPGFIHSKIMVEDGKMAVVGSVNLDYRSLYHHFEAGVCLYKTSSIIDIKTDFEKVLNDSVEITSEFCEKHRFRQFFQNILRFFAPLF